MWEKAVDQVLQMADARALWFVLGWLTLALINAGLAQGKRRSGALWFALSLPLGPLATLIVVLLPRVRSKMF